MEVEIMSRKTIKPSSPTPQNSKTFKLSVWDQLVPPVYCVAVFFYHPNADQNNDDNIVSRFSQRSLSLQKSLSDVLVQYYPLAGRLKDDSTIDCNDEGAYFMEARIHCLLSDFLSQPDAKLLKQFIPITADPKFKTNCTLAVQITLFNCGGMVISVCPSHKIADASSLCYFARSWTAMTRDEHCKLEEPNFVDASFSPSKDLITEAPRVQESPSGNFTTKRLVFHASKIASLRANFLEARGHQQFLTNVDVVLAFILKCAISASRSLSRTPDDAIFFHIVNVRKRIVPPLSEITMGNIYWTVPVIFEANEVELVQLAGKVRKNLTTFYKDKASKINVDYQGELFDNLNCKNYYGCTSWCSFPLYEMDFGWGRPLWVTSPIFGKNLIVLWATKEGDGIEAWVSLEDNEMTKFESDDELLAFASANPSAFAC